jgi:hypothetical protein
MWFVERGLPQFVQFILRECDAFLLQQLCTGRELLWFVMRILLHVQL